MIENFQGMPPDQAQTLKALLQLPGEAIQPMCDALERWHVSPDVARNPEGLLTDAEIQEALSLLRTDTWTANGLWSSNSP